MKQNPVIRASIPLYVMAFLVAGVFSILAGAQQDGLDGLLPTLDTLVSPDARRSLAEELLREQSRLQSELDANVTHEQRAELSGRLRAIGSALRLVGEPVAATPLFDDEALRFFESKVRPILIEKCHACHGEEKQKSNLRLDSRGAVLKGGDHGAAVVAGDADAGLMVNAIRYTGKISMPPDSKLPQDQIDALIEWVRMGAPWPDEAAVAQAAESTGIDIAKGREWWSFRPLAAFGPPVVKDEAWALNAVDRFILAKLESEKVAPAAPAAKHVLIRRATFDLIGLPPAPEDVEAFVADKSPDAFAKVVERLLASPHYGERWGRHWLDVVRYTDSFDSRGTPATDPVNSWRYRDWVVGALNRDMPYNEFIKHQIAGDLIPDSAAPGSGFNRDGAIATAMLAIGNWPQGDADKEKMVTDIVDDQIDVVTRGIMGVTLSCARCHDHKFDPFTTQDYYGLAGIFFSSHILPGPGQKTEGSPILHIPLAPVAEIAARDAHIARLREAEAAEKQQSDALRAMATATLVKQTGPYLLAAWDFAEARKSNPGIDVVAFAKERGLNDQAVTRWLNQLGLNPLRALHNPVPAIQGIAGLASWQGDGGMPTAVFNTTANEVTYATIKQPARSVAVHPSPASGVAVSWTSPLAGAVLVLGRAADADPTCGNGVTWRIERRHGGAIQTLAEGVADNAGAIEIAPEAQPLGPVAVEQGDSILLIIEPRGDYSCDTTVVELQITDVCDTTRVWNLNADVLVDPLQANPHADAMGNAGVWSFVDLSSPAAPADSPLSVWNAAVNGDQAARTQAAASVQGSIDAVLTALSNENDASKLPDEPNTRFYTLLVSDKGPYWIDPLSNTAPESADAREKLVIARGTLAGLRAQPAPEFEFTEGVQEGGIPNTPYAGIQDVKVHKRGSYTQLGDSVPRGFPAVLASAERTPEMKGSGRLQLAEWSASAENPLTARVIVNRIWQHHFGEGIVRTPGNFGKLGVPPTHPELLDYLAQEFIRSGWSLKTMHRLIMLSATYQQSSGAVTGSDPENLLFARMNRRRLEAEPLRDAMLAVSGKLDLSVGGQPFKDLATPRRTIYFRTVRSDRTSYTMLFDAADPTAIIDTRTESTVAPQALFLINNPFVLEQAKALSERALTFSATDDGGRIARLYAILFARAPHDEEVAIGAQLIDSARDAFAEDEARAWQEYCQILLCSNEFAFVD